MSARTFSAAAQFNNGQWVSAFEQTGVAIGWRHGRLGKTVAVKFTSGPMKGRTIGVHPSFLTARAGRKGNGPLRPLNDND